MWLSGLQNGTALAVARFETTARSRGIPRLVTVARLLSVPCFENSVGKDEIVSGEWHCLIRGAALGQHPALVACLLQNRQILECKETTSSSIFF